MNLPCSSPPPQCNPTLKRCSSRRTLSAYTYSASDQKLALSSSSHVSTSPPSEDDFDDTQSPLNQGEHLVVDARQTFQPTPEDFQIRCSRAQSFSCSLVVSPVEEEKKKKKEQDDDQDSELLKKEKVHVPRRRPQKRHSLSTTASDHMRGDRPSLISEISSRSVDLNIKDSNQSDDEENSEPFLDAIVSPKSERVVEFDVSGFRPLQKSHSINVSSSSRTRRRSSASTADIMIRRKEGNLLMLQEDLINEVREFCLAEVKGSFKHVIEEWGSKSVTTSSMNDQELREEKLEHDSLQGLQIANAVRNFIQHLPLRYPLSVESPSEVMLHMRSLALAARYPSRPCVHVANIDHSQELNQLAFRPSEHGMSNLKRISIAVVHTLGFMEFLMGLLVSGGNDILDIDFTTSADKIVLVRVILNVKGTLRLNKLQKHIEFFVCASRGILCDSSQADAPILSRIGAVDPVQLSEHQVDEFSHVHMSLDDDGTVMAGTGRSKRKQSYAEMATEDHGSIIEVLKRDNIMDQSCDEGCIQNEFFNNILVTGKVKLSDGRFGASIYRGKLMDKRIRPSIQSVGSEEWQNESSAFIALKVASSDNSNEANEVIEELRREGQVAKELHHDNICRLLDTFETPSLVCLAYEFCGEGSLFSLISDPNASYNYLPIIDDIARGMAYLHSKNVVHRDLKPENIFLDNNRRAKIADFGMSITHTGHENLTGETGTYRWMAPEVIRHEPYSLNSDVYSFGICLWQLATRCPRPYYEYSPVQAAYAVANGTRPAVPSYVPAYIRKLIVLSWDHDQQKRPSFAYISMFLTHYINATNEVTNSQHEMQTF